MSKAKLTSLVLAAQMLGCVLIWRSMADSKVTGISAIAFCITALVSGMTLVILSEASKLLIVMGVIGSAVAANIANIAYDLFRDPTSHNLFPFELGITAAISLVGAGIGLGTSAIWRKLNSASGSNK
jgi:hypothetical protein